MKSTATVHDVHLHDLAVQLFVLEGCGVRVSEAGILHLNREYVRATAAVNVDALFEFADLHDEARELRPDILANLRRWRRLLVRTSPPDVAPGTHCNDPYPCPFAGHCIAPPGKMSLRRLPRQAALIEAVGDRAPDDVRRIPDDVKVSELQARAIECLKTGEEYVGPGLARDLAEVEYPIHFLDFETVMPAVPRYRATRVYQTLPFQWSDHVLHERGRLEHHEYLHLEDSDPRQPFLVQLLAALGTEGTIVVFTAYERTQLGALADGVPGYRRRIGKVQERLLDLHRIVKEHYYHPDLDGSFSLKALVPAVVPKLSYGAITSGQEAAATYEELLHPATSPSRRVTLERALRRYCRTDTLAMVKLWQTFRRRAARVAGAL